MAELIAAVSGAVLGVLGGYILGVRQDRKQLQYQQRTIAITEVRKRFHAVRQAFTALVANTSTNSADVPTRLEDARKLFDELKAIDGYWKAQSPWMEAKSEDVFGILYANLIASIARYHTFLKSSPSPQDLDTMSERYNMAIYVNQPGLRELFDGLDKETERIINAPPWWRRLKWWRKREGQLPSPA